MSAEVQTHGVEVQEDQEGIAQEALWIQTGRRRDHPLLLGATIKESFLEESITTTRVSLQGRLAELLLEIQQAAKQKFLPIVSLRAALMAEFEGLLHLERNLGLDGKGAPAMELDGGADEEGQQAKRESDIKVRFLRCLQLWVDDGLVPWSKANGCGNMVNRLRALLTTDLIGVMEGSRKFVERGRTGVAKPNFNLVARQLAMRLLYEELFPTMGEVELVADPTSSRGSVELMTVPKRLPGTDAVASMVARLTVFTVPFSDRLYVKVSPLKRVWASRKPGRKPNAPRRVTCYVKGPNRPFMLVDARQGPDGWEFEEEFAAFHRMVDPELPLERRLPSNLETAVAKTLPESDDSWWAGLPELTTLFDRVKQRSTLEKDEADLFDNAMRCLDADVDRIADKRVVKLARATVNNSLPMLREADLDLSAEDGYAGAALVEAREIDPEDDEQEAEAEEQEEARHAMLAARREANRRALRVIHQDALPTLWVFGANSREQEVIEQCMDVLFGDAVQLHFNALPADVHGLQKSLPADGRKGRERFAARLDAWKAATGQIAGAPGARHVLICAPLAVAGRPEDQVNYFAGISAMCAQADANVHYVVPIEEDPRLGKPKTQHFLHRLQSALMDVFLAHSGMVLGAMQLVANCLGALKPAAIYGVQVVRSEAKTFSHEETVTFTLFTRTLVESGVTEIKIYYREGRANRSTVWLPLKEGLRWLGQQRQINGDRAWLRGSFTEHLKDFVQEVAGTDPRAVVLVDWGTLESLWSDLSDEALSSNGAVRIGGASLPDSCRDMTFVRLRSGEFTLVARKEMTRTFEGKAFATAGTAILTEEKYQTTTPTIIDLTPDSDSKRKHYLMMMGYRKTAQMRRGMSCYRPTERMKKIDAKNFARRTYPPSKDDVGLPRGLEVTVINCPAAINPDNMAALVMGLRLRFAHHDEWTALPAPLFFSRKVVDYVIRYPEAIVVETAVVADVESGDAQADGEGTENSYAKGVGQEVLRVISAKNEARQPQSPGHAALAGAASEPAPMAGLQALAETTQHEQEQELDEDQVVLERAIAASRSVRALRSYEQTGIVGRKLNEDMFTGRLRVSVGMPWFVTEETIVTAGSWPDKRTIRQAWRTMNKYGYIGPNERAPSVDLFRSWLMKKLLAPQSTNIILSMHFFSDSAPLFAPLATNYKEFLNQLEGDRPPLSEGLPLPVPELMQWLATKGSDCGVAWLVLGIAHMPMYDGQAEVLQKLRDFPIGPFTRAALKYLAQSAEVVGSLYDRRLGGEKKFEPITIKADPRPESSVEDGVESGPSFLPSGDGAPAAEATANVVPRDLLGFATTQAPPNPVSPGRQEDMFRAQVMPGGVPSEFDANRDRSEFSATATGAPNQGETQGPEQAMRLASSLANAGLVPGAAGFAEGLSRIRSLLDELETTHQSLHEERSRLEADVAAAMAASIQRQQQATELEHRVSAVLSQLNLEMQVGSWLVHAPVGDIATDWVEAATSEVLQLEIAIFETVAAQRELEDIESGLVEGLAELPLRERAKRKAHLTHQAMARLDAAEAQAMQRFRECRLVKEAAQGGSSGESVNVHEVAAGSAQAAAKVSSASAFVAGPAGEPTVSLTALEERHATEAKPPMEDSTVLAPPFSLETSDMRLSDDETTAPGIWRRETPEQAWQAQISAREGSDGLGLPGSLVGQEVAAVELAGSLGASNVHALAAQTPQTKVNNAYQANGGEDVILEQEEEVQEAALATEQESRVEDDTLFSENVRKVFECARRKHWTLASVGNSAMAAMSGSSGWRIDSLIWHDALESLVAIQYRDESSPRGTPGVDQIALSGISHDETRSGDKALRLGLLGASLLSLLVHMTSESWWAVMDMLKPLEDAGGALSRLIQQLKHLEKVGMPLDRERLAEAKVDARRSMQAELRRMRARAANWANDADLTIEQGSDYKAVHVLLFSAKNNNPIGKCLELIAQGQDDKAKSYFADATRAISKGGNTVDSARKHTGRKIPLAGVGRNVMIRNLSATAKFLKNYFDVVDRAGRNAASASPSRLTNELESLFNHVVDSIAQVSDIQFTCEPDKLHQELCVANLALVLDLMQDKDERPVLGEQHQLVMIQVPLGIDGRPSFSWNVEYRDASGTATSPVDLADPERVLEELVDAELEIKERGGDQSVEVVQKLVERAASEHRKFGRVLAARRAEAILGRATASPADSTFKSEKNRLDAYVTEVRQKVRSAMALKDAIAEEQANEMLRVLDDITAVNDAQRIGSLTAASEAFPDFPHAWAVVKKLVVSPLDQIIDVKRVEIHAELEAWIDDEKEKGNDPADTASGRLKIERIRKQLQAATVWSTRIAEQYLSLLMEGNLPTLEAKESNVEESYQQFRNELKSVTKGHRTLDGLRQLLTLPAIEEGPAWLTSLGLEQRNAAVELIDKWTAVCSTESRGEISKSLNEFFASIGLPPQCFESHSSTGSARTRLEFYAERDMLVGASRAKGQPFVPPILGSAARFIEGNVLRNFPKEGEFLQVVAQRASGQSTPLLLLGRANLALAERSNICRDNPVVLIDDDLVAYMAVTSDERVARLLRVTMLTFNTNPYDDHSGPVPREMFFGREKELKQVEGVKVAGVLYGGRRLGKSSLLDQIQNESRDRLYRFPNTRQGEIAVYIPLVKHHDSGEFSENYELFSWKSIYRTLEAVKFLEPAPHELTTTEAIFDWIQAQARAGKTSRTACFLLIDEADEVMYQDMKHGSQFVARLQSLCESLRDACQMRYVIAGLHNLSRSASGPNSPFGKVEPIALRPFANYEGVLNAMDLITRPLNALGFRFREGSEELQMRILCLCNFYPAFIQLYCKTLLRGLYNKRFNKPPPTFIEESDLDTTEKDEGFIESIQRLFRWTLDLDKRYKAIALILAHDYYENTGKGAVKGMEIGEIRQQCQLLTSKHFEGTSTTAYDALVDEMEKLTVVEKSGTRYRLKTSQIPMMVGNHLEVLEKIDTLNDEEADTSRMPGDARPEMTQGSERAPFPMPSAWVRKYMAEESTELVILVGNMLSGIHILEKLKGQWQLGLNTEVERIMKPNRESYLSYLSSARRADAGRRPLKCISSWRIEQLESYIDVAHAMSKSAGVGSQKQKAGALRLMMLATPEQAWALAQREAMGALPSGCRVEPISAWSDDALYFRLDYQQNHDGRDSKVIRELLMEASCGFGRELHRMTVKALDEDAARICLSISELQLAPDLKVFYDRIGRPSGIPDREVKEFEQFLQLIHGVSSLTDMTENEIVEDYKEKFSPALFKFMRWMALLQIDSKGNWFVPALYRKLVTQA